MTLFFWLELLNLSDEFAQCKYVFGAETVEQGLRNNIAFQQRFGGATPGV